MPGIYLESTQRMLTLINREVGSTWVMDMEREELCKRPELGPVRAQRGMACVREVERKGAALCVRMSSLVAPDTSHTKAAPPRPRGNPSLGQRLLKPSTSALWSEVLGP